MTQIGLRVDMAQQTSCRAMLGPGQNHHALCQSHLGGVSFWSLVKQSGSILLNMCLV
jgi:hypothetical protein